MDDGRKRGWSDPVTITEKNNALASLAEGDENENSHSHESSSQDHARKLARRRKERKDRCNLKKSFNLSMGRIPLEKIREQLPEGFEQKLLEEALLVEQG